MFLDWAYLIASSMRWAYWGFWAAAKIKEGLVVASWGLYWAIANMKPSIKTSTLRVFSTYIQNHQSQRQLWWSSWVVRGQTYFIIGVCLQKGKRKKEMTKCNAVPFKTRPVGHLTIIYKAGFSSSPNLLNGKRLCKAKLFPSPLSKMPIKSCKSTVLPITYSYILSRNCLFDV